MVIKDWSQKTNSANCQEEKLKYSGDMFKPL